MRLKKNIAISETGFVFDPNSGDSFSLNNIAKEIIEQLQEGKNRNEVSAFVIDKYDVDEYSFERNLDDFYGMLKHHKLIDNEPN